MHVGELNSAFGWTAKRVIPFSSDLTLERALVMMSMEEALLYENGRKQVRYNQLFQLCFMIIKG